MMSAAGPQKIDEVAIVMRDVSSLKPYERNPRKNDAAVDRMIASIQEFGFKIPVLAKSDGSVIDGHLRLKAAEKLRLMTVPVILCDDWTEAQVKAFRLIVNRSVTWADWDEELLKLELADLKSFDYSLELTGFDPDEIATLLSPAEILGLTDEDAAPEAPPDPITQPGDLWVLGNHRLLCGDSTSISDVQRLMEDELADLIFTDPPYNVAYSGRGEVNQLGTIQNDNLTDDEFDAFIAQVFSCCSMMMRDLAPIYVAHPDSKSAPPPSSGSSRRQEWGGRIIGRSTSQSCTGGNEAKARTTSSTTDQKQRSGKSHAMPRSAIRTQRRSPWRWPRKPFATAADPATLCSICSVDRVRR